MVREREEYTFFWFVEQYSYCWHENREVLISPTFTADGLEGTKWTLQLYPRGISDDYKTNISLFLNRSSLDDGPESIMVQYELSFLSSAGSTNCSIPYDRTFKRGDGHGSPNFLTLNEVYMQTHQKDILTVRCKIWKGDGNIRKIAPICARTRIGIERISFLHKIENFSNLQPNQRHTIKVSSNSQNECLALSSVQYADNSLGMLMIEIIPTNCNHVLSKGKISFVQSGNIIKCAEDDIRYGASKSNIPNFFLSIPRRSIVIWKNDTLWDDKLSLLCEVVFSTGLEFSKIEETRHKIYLPAARLRGKLYKNTEKSDISGAMKALYLNRSLTDVELRTNTGSFSAHKIVLCARSPVFKAMLTSGMQEQKTNLVRVEDLGVDVLERFLLYLYSDAVENLEWEVASQLYYAADKYQVDALKGVCSSFLIENLIPSRASELLLLADTHSDPDLKAVVEDFILEYDTQVFASVEWERLMETHPLFMKAMHLK